MRADAAAGGGEVVEGARPSGWLSSAFEAGEVERELLLGLCAALVRSAHPQSVLEVALLAARCHLTELAPVFQAAVAGLDVGVLLHPDPHADGASVEDALLRAWSSVEGGEGERLVALLDRLRHAGLRSEELAVLVRLADAETIARRLPPILVEALPVEDVDALATGLCRSGAIAHAIAAASGPLNGAQRYAVWRAAEAREPAIGADDALRAAWLVAG